MVEINMEEYEWKQIEFVSDVAVRLDEETNELVVQVKKTTIQGWIKKDKNND